MSTLTLQKPGMLQLQGVPFDKLRGEAVVVYANSLTGGLHKAAGAVSSTFPKVQERRHGFQCLLRGSHLLDSIYICPRIQADNRLADL